MLKAYNEFESRVEHLKHHNLSKPERIKNVIDQKVGKITKKEIMELCPDISKVTVERTLIDMVKFCKPFFLSASLVYVRGASSASRYRYTI